MTFVLALSLMLEAQSPTCLSREAVSARVAPLVPADQRSSTSWDVERHGDRARIVWLDSSGKLQKERWIAGSESCAQLERTAAVVIAAWISSAPRIEPAAPPDPDQVPRLVPAGAAPPSTPAPSTTMRPAVESPQKAIIGSPPTSTGQKKAAREPPQIAFASPLVATGTEQIAKTGSPQTTTGSAQTPATGSPSTAALSSTQNASTEAVDVAPPPEEPEPVTPPAEARADPQPTASAITPPPEPSVPVHFEIALDVRGTWAPSIGPAVGIRVDLGSTFGGFLELSAEPEHRAPLGNGFALWQRSALSVGARYRKSWGRFFLEPGLAVEAALLRVRGEGFKETRSSMGLDGSGCGRLHLGARIWGGLHAVIGVRGCASPFANDVRVLGVVPTYALPRGEVSVLTGFFWSFAPLQGSGGSSPSPDQNK